MTGTGQDVELHTRFEDGTSLPFLVWRFLRPMRVVSSAPVGGGLGVRSWIINAQVAGHYGRTDLEAHICELALVAGLDPQPDHVGLLTAADVSAGFEGFDRGVHVRASVGVREPVWAAAPAADPGEPAGRGDGIEVLADHGDDGDAGGHRGDRANLGRSDPRDARDPREPIGTINIVAFVPVPMTESALVNLITTATEAKTQALFDAGIDGTGTVTDAVVVVSPRLSAAPTNSLERFGGSRSTWGAPLARAVHSAVFAGAQHSQKVVAAERSTSDRR